MTKILDIQKTIIAANGNTSLAKDLFSMLLADLDLRQQQIIDSSQAKDMALLAEHIHKLYGATAYCIVPNLRQSAAVLEEALRKNEPIDIMPLVENVLTEIKSIINEGPSYIDKDWSDFE